MKKNVCLYAMMALAFMGCLQNSKKQENSSKGLPSRVESESKAGAEKAGQSVAGSSNQSASAGKVQVLTASDFRKKIMDYESHPDEWVFAGSRPAVIDFYTTWCGPCKMIGPIFEEVAGELTNAKFTKVNVDECPNLAGKYRVASIPTIMVFKNGEPVDTLVGFMPKNQLKDAVEKHL